jgi:hypothetical protein
MTRDITFAAEIFSKAFIVNESGDITENRLQAVSRVAQSV